MSMTNVKKPMTGVRVWKNPINEFVVFELHYSADPQKRSEIFRDATKSKLPLQKFLQEYEIQWDTYEGMPVYRDYERSKHHTDEIPMPERGLPLLTGWDFGLCYDNKTEVLTRSGWKLFKDVSDSEEVATMCPETFKLFYEVPKLKVDMPYDGEMIVWDSNTLKAQITTDHIVPVWKEGSKKFERYYAKDLMGQGHNLIRLTSDWEGNCVENPLGLPQDVYCQFMGMYLSEGCCEDYRVTIYQNNSNKFWCRDILEKTGWDWVDSNECLRINNREIAKYLSGFGLSGDKFVPDEIKNSSKENIKEFIRTYTLGDGNIRTRPNGSEEHTVFSKSKRMIDDLSELALKAGWVSSIREVGPSKSFLKSENRIINSSGGWSISFKKGYDFSHLREAKKEKIKYSGRVYCLSVSTGLLYVRKDGRPHWNGNTPACVIAQLQGDRLVIIKEIVAFNMGAKRFAQKVKMDIATNFPFWGDISRSVKCWIDPSGLFRKDTDESTCKNELVSAGFKDIYPGPVDWEARRSAVEDFLVKTTREGNCFVVSENSAPQIVKGFAGGYHYPENAINRSEDQKPVKNEFSHPHDALQYLCHGVNGIIRSQKRYKSVPRPSYGNTKR